MPIKPENKARYPKNWKQIRQQILDRARNRCEMCGVKNYTYRRNPKTDKIAYIVLTIAHIHNHDPADCRPENLMALCQRCHNGLDAKMRAEHARATRLAKDKSLKIPFDKTAMEEIKKDLQRHIRHCAMMWNTDEDVVMQAMREIVNEYETKNQ